MSSGTRIAERGFVGQHRFLLWSIFPLILAVACGGEDPRGRIWTTPGDTTQPPDITKGAHTSPAPDAGKGYDYKNPAPGDGGCGAPNRVCGGTCVSILSELDHCGACDNKCVGATAACVGGSCICQGEGMDYCAAGCQDVSSDVNNCGTCGKVCDPNQFNACVGGRCVVDDQTQ
jgi:hypothetical protein